MSLYKRGRIWWFHFIVEGHHYQESTHLTDKSGAARVQATRRLEIAKVRSGIHRPGLFAVARELHHIAEILDKLDPGNADASTRIGAVDLLSRKLKEGSDSLVRDG